MIERGANVNAKDRDGRKPLFSVFDRFDFHRKRFITADPAATEKELLPILARLLDSGADASIKNTDGKTVIERYKTMPKAFRDLLEASTN